MCVITAKEVHSFLADFKAKKSIWGVLYRDDRGKNAQTLADLELRPIERDGILDALEPEDYCQGPLEENLYGGSNMWVFGKEVRKNDIYIKITLGVISAGVICVSFHVAEYALIYPFKEKKP